MRVEQDGFPRYILLDGDVHEGDARRFRNLLESYRDPPVSLVILNSTGGRFGESALIAETVAAKKLRTVVPWDGRCGSGCVAIFAAGATRFVGRGAKLGLHRAAVEGGGETPASVHATDVFARLLARFDVPQPIIARMLATPHDKVAELSEGELRSMGVIVLDAEP